MDSHSGRRAFLSSLLRRIITRVEPPERPSRQSLYPYVYVEVDGTARELHADERVYLETEFEGGDGAAPHIKSKYEKRDGWGELSGYLKRSKLPAGSPVKPAPLEDPNKPLDRDEYIAYLRGKGFQVIENADGTFTEDRIVYHWVDSEGRPESDAQSSQSHDQPQPRVTFPDTE